MASVSRPVPPPRRPCNTCRRPFTWGTRPPTTPGYEEGNFLCDGGCGQVLPFPGYFCVTCQTDVCLNCARGMAGAGPPVTTISFPRGRVRGGRRSRSRSRGRGRGRRRARGRGRGQIRGRLNQLLGRPGIGMGIGMGGSVGGAVSIPKGPVPVALQAFMLQLIPKFDSECGANFVFSSYSIFRILALTMGGARGRTASEMARTLCLPEGAVSSVHDELGVIGKAFASPSLSVAEAVFVRQNSPLVDSFVRICETKYDAMIQAVDFPSEGVRIVNGFVNEKTKGMITKIVEFLGPDTEAVLVNCVYFKANWKDQFDPRHTRDLPFKTFVDQGSPSCAMMFRRKAKALYGEHQLSGVGFQSCLLEYNDDKFGMVFLKPNQGEQSAVFGRFLEGISQHPNLMELVQSESRRHTLSRLLIPKFTIESGCSMVDMLQELGMVLPFGAADFSGMIAGGGVAISDVIHKSKIILDEVGTEAAAATAVVMSRSACRPAPQKEFVLDSPFVCFIVEVRSRQVLFSTIVRFPTES